MLSVEAVNGSPSPSSASASANFQHPGLTATRGVGQVTVMWNFHRLFFHPYRKMRHHAGLVVSTMG